MSEQIHHSHVHNSIEFQVLCQTHFGEQVRICGSSIQLGNWNPLLGHRLFTNQSIYPKWKSHVPLIIMNTNKIEYKACIIAHNTIVWQRNTENRKVSCLQPSIVEFVYDQPKQIITEKIITEIDCRQGTLDILQELQGSQSSIDFKSNYPIEQYFQNQDNGSLQRSRGLSGSDLSSNLFSPNGGTGGGSEEGEIPISDFQVFTIKCRGTPQLSKTRSIRPQLVRKSDETKLLLNIQDLNIMRDRSRSRSVERSDSGGHNKSEQPQSPYMIHVPSIENKDRTSKVSNPTTKASVYGSQRVVQIINEQKKQRGLQGTTDCSSTNQQNDENKSNSTVIQYDTQDEYLTTRDEDVMIEDRGLTVNDV